MESRLPKRVRPHVARGPERSRQLHWRTPLERERELAGSAATASAPPRLLQFVRHGVPGLIVLAGIVAICFGTETSLIGGGGLIGAGLSVWLVSWFYRIGIQGEAAREREERARTVFERTGRWPEP